MAITHALRQRPASKVQRRGQRPNKRRYPPDGLEWGQEGWPDLIPGTPVPATGATAGIPGTWTPPGSIPRATNSNMAGIVANPLTPWQPGEYVACADATQAHWVGAAWAMGPATLFSPVGKTIAEVQEHVNGFAMDGQRAAKIQAILDIERANANRTTLVSWLDQQLGVE